MTLARRLYTSALSVARPRVSPFVHARHFNVLAIESSADDTCAAIVDSSRRILSNVVIKQHDMFVAFKSIVSVALLTLITAMKNSEEYIQSVP